MASLQKVSNASASSEHVVMLVTLGSLDEG